MRIAILSLLAAVFLAVPGKAQVPVYEIDTTASRLQVRVLWLLSPPVNLRCGVFTKRRGMR
jgi:hypothetical protein